MLSTRAGALPWPCWPPYGWYKPGAIGLLGQCPPEENRVLLSKALLLPESSEILSSPPPTVLFNFLVVFAFPVISRLLFF